MKELLKRLGAFCNDSPRRAQIMIDVLNYAITNYGFNSSRDYWRERIVNDRYLLGNVPGVDNFYNIMEGYDECEK